MIGKKYFIKLKNKKVKCYSNEVSKDVVLGKNVIIGKKVKIGNNVVIGENSYINYETIIDSNSKIGKFCSIAPQVYIGPGNHPLSYVSTHPFLYDTNWSEKLKCNVQKHEEISKDTMIGNDVWIGTRAIILAGVNVSDGSIVAAGAVVTKDIPPYSIVAGIPAKVIGYRFEEEIIDKIKEIKWWDWPEEKLRKNYNNFFKIDDMLNNKED
ncbi:MAG: DapH/DapD/GlmU-related protein [Clostridia bacterium]|nr:DapH/DapD/GlmU-related protein [Clostridia bacterium]